MLEKHAALDLVSRLQTEMKQLNIWQSDPLPQDAFTSCEPFSVDKMKFEQWLQFILVPTLTTILQNNLPMPDKFGIAPMAKHCMGENNELSEIHQIIETIDRSFGKMHA